MADCPVLIIADSRGRYLDAALKSKFVHLKYRLIWRGGLKFSEVPAFANHVIMSEKRKLVYIICGICKITCIKFKEPWTVAMRDISVDNSVYNYMVNLDNLHAQL